MEPRSANRTAFCLGLERDILADLIFISYEEERMKKSIWLAMALMIALLPLGVRAGAPLDFTAPTVTWNAPGEGSCWQIDAAHPDLGLVVSAEDDSGVKQGTMWMKAGHYGLTSNFRDWPRVWGHTYAHDGSAPPSVRETIMIRMLGRAEGEYTFIVEFADMARHNMRHKVLHVSIDCAPPTVSITSPADGRVVCRDRSLVVNAAASDSGCGILQVQLYLNAVTPTTPVAVDTSAPYQLIVPKSLLAVDSLRIIVKAVDKSGRASQAEVTVHPTMICLVRRTR
jgi:hypothetical protein